MSVDGASLRAEVLAFMAAPVGVPPEDGPFETLALRVFAWQFEQNPTYGAYCRRRGRTPANVSAWTDIPALPTHAFKALRVVSGSTADGGSGEPGGALFRTSGTTQGRERRGEHHVPELALYDASLLPTFDAFVLPDGARPPMLSLVPPAAAVPDSSLAYMVTRVLDAHGGPGSGTFMDGAGQLDARALEAALRHHTAGGTPVCILGTSLAFLHWLESLDERGGGMELPAGSRIMDTGGYKGLQRTVPEGELRAAYARLLGLPPERCVNEYGMTELLSQYYDDGLRRDVLGLPLTAGGTKAGPPWLRAVAADPDTLDPLPPGEEGILRHVDLANLRSVVAVQTEDLGVVFPDGRLALRGRLPGAVPRGCSRAMDQLITAARNP